MLHRAFFDENKLTPIKLALLRNIPSDDYPSMKVVAEELHDALNENPELGVSASHVFPGYRETLIGSLVKMIRPSLGDHVNRLMNLFYVYPAQLSHLVAGFDAFLVCDQGCSQLLHRLPSGRSGVFCHDINTFYCGIDPDFQPRAHWITRRLAKHVAAGFKKARIVFYSTESVRSEILKYDLAPPEKLIKATFGIHPDFRPPANANALPPELEGVSYLLHVGSCWERKRIDVLLDVFAGIKRTRADVKLVKVGGTWSDEQRAQMKQLEIESSIIHWPWVERQRLASLYGHAGVVMMPSDSEGFGLPLIEALACGAIVLASKIEVFQEIGKDSLVYCPVADVSEWTNAALNLLSNPQSAPGLETRLRQASKYSWTAFAMTVAKAYRDIL